MKMGKISAGAGDTKSVPNSTVKPLISLEYCKMHTVTITPNIILVIISPQMDNRLNLILVVWISFSFW